MPCRDDPGCGHGHGGYSEDGRAGGTCLVALVIEILTWMLVVVLPPSHEMVHLLYPALLYLGTC